MQYCFEPGCTYSSPIDYATVMISYIYGGLAWKKIGVDRAETAADTRTVKYRTTPCMHGRVRPLLEKASTWCTIYCMMNGRGKCCHAWSVAW